MTIATKIGARAGHHLLPGDYVPVSVLPAALDDECHKCAQSLGETEGRVVIGPYGFALYCDACRKAAA